MHFVRTAFIGGCGRGALLRVDTFPRAHILQLLLMGHSGHELMLWLCLHHIRSPEAHCCANWERLTQSCPPCMGVWQHCVALLPWGCWPARSEQHSRGIYKMCTENKYKKGEVIKNNKSGELRNASAALLTRSSQPGEQDED